MSAESLQQVIGLVGQLSPDELAVVLQNVSARLAQPTEPRRSVLELQGLGKEAWRGVDVEPYIDQERSSWNG